MPETGDLQMRALMHEVPPRSIADSAFDRWLQGDLVRITWQSMG